ncbi:glycoside hydrolase family 9 protein [Robertkochia flava]|uniref:glycoside hydrolase family 9 protein n=1 Tax=Robertkochia flava TaxID=3447986 RepID=UPI001CCF6C68|nr:glycoside hydrolase family 9 protein [Robertkochia marina]
MSRIICLILSVLCLSAFVPARAQEYPAFRLNQLGYLPEHPKSAFLLADSVPSDARVPLFDKLTGRKVGDVAVQPARKGYYELEELFSLDFSFLRTPGVYYFEWKGIKSPDIRIAQDVYAGTADFLLQYMRSRRCGYNPYFDKTCHEHDGVIIYHPEREGEKIDVTGGWHDASDYLQYVTTSANATFQLLFAYEQNPHAFSDRYQADGRPGPNGVPDILDEAKWGLDWLVKMNPEPGVMFHQIADDRDHRSFDLPYRDTLDYGFGKGKERPVYFVTGQPQGLMEYKNRSNGKANIAGKFASCFALGSELLKPYYPDFAADLLPKAIAAYKEGVAYPGVCQTAPCRAPYFYEEENWADDMELAAAQLYRQTQQASYLRDAFKFEAMEPVTPWMTRDTVRHYQYYPFVNLGHYYLAPEEKGGKVLRDFEQGIRENVQRGRSNVFQNGIPFVWCSNNLAAAMLTQFSLRSRLPGDPAPEEEKTEAALRDWLFGKNPWGTSMVVGLPAHGDYPSDTHAAISRFTPDEPWGGLVDGPVYTSIFKSLKGVKLSEADEYASFQTSKVVYHDDWADYSTNEPTMDGTASLTYYLSSLAPEVPEAGYKRTHRGALISGDTLQKRIALIFTGHDRAEGFEQVHEALRKHSVKASFFLTGAFYRNPEFKPVITTLKEEGHYLGAHSDGHLLYCSWENRDSLLVDESEFAADLRANYRAMEEFGIQRKDAYFYLPPYEWYNDTIASWTSSYGLRLINHTPGTNSNQDWTYPGGDASYFSNSRIWDNIMTYEREHSLNGFHMLIHFGTDPRRVEKFYDRLDALITDLKSKGYEFVSIDEMHEDGK